MYWEYFTEVLQTKFENAFPRHFLRAKYATGHSSGVDQDGLLSLTSSYFSGGEGSLMVCSALLCVLQEGYLEREDGKCEVKEGAKIPFNTSTKRVCVCVC